MPCISHLWESNRAWELPVPMPSVSYLRVSPAPCPLDMAPPGLPLRCLTPAKRASDFPEFVRLRSFYLKDLPPLWVGVDLLLRYGADAPFLPHPSSDLYYFSRCLTGK